MKTQVLLFVNLHANVVQQPQRGERIENVPITDAVLAAAEHAHVHATLGGRRDALGDGRIHKFRVLDVECLLGAIDELDMSWREL